MPVRLLLVLVGLGLMFALRGQHLPAAYSSGITTNSIRTYSAVAPFTTDEAVRTASYRDVQTTISYFDGIGRGLQDIMLNGAYASGSSPKDLVNASTYDQYGRVVYSYLPFASDTVAGAFRMNPFQLQQAFYGSILSGQSETFYYGKTEFEASPLSRPIKTLAPGNNWVGSSRGVDVKYHVNLAGDSVRKIDVVDVAGGWATYQANGFYSAGELRKTISVDEHGKQVIEFKDKEGKVLLKKVQHWGNTDTGNGQGYTGWLTTIYVYDAMGRLRLVVQPVGVRLLIQNTWNFSALSGAILSEQGFRYEYDGRGRMIRKKVPGAGEVRMAYDLRDRLVLAQDSSQRTQNKWSYTQYDSLSRPSSSGIWTDLAARSFSQILSLSAANVGVISGGSFDELTVSYYGSYTWVAAPLSQNRLSTWDSYLLTPSNSTYPYPQAAVKSNLVNGYVTGTKTKVLGTSTFLYSVNIYDDKGRVIQVQRTNLTGGVDVITTQYSWSGKPLIVIEKTEKAGTNSQTSVVLSSFDYDELGRLIQVRKRVSHSLVNGGAMPSAWTTVARHSYDGLGRIKSKTVGVTSARPQGLDSLVSDYNVRGWLLGINRRLLNGAMTDGFFGFELGYDKSSGVFNGSGFTGLQYNGNISGMVWRSKGDAVQRKYDYGYDAVNRLLSGNFSQFNGTTDMNFSVSGLDYDDNGNIRKMDQQGWKLSGPAFIDKLRYNYQANSNKLLNVIDSAQDAATKLGDFRTSSNHPNVANKTAATVDYLYDGNGNLRRDYNKDLGNSTTDGISYNHLNLPQQVTVKVPSGGSGGNKGIITYTYDAAGTKLQKQVVDYSEAGRTITTTTKYIGGSVYESRTISPADPLRKDYTDVLQFIAHEEGRIRYLPLDSNRCPIFPNRLYYDYFLKDHLGNVRMVLTEQSETQCYVPATVEDGSWATESLIYSIVDTRRVLKTSVGADAIGSFGQKVYRTNGATTAEKTGLGVMLKVMQGDTVRVRVESFYTLPGGGNVGAPLLMGVMDLISALTTATGFPVSKGLTGTHVNAISGNTTSLGNFINNRTTPGTQARAALNWILFDDQFHYVTGGYELVNNNGGYKSHDQFFNNPLMASKNGFLYIYVSNESNLQVFFDNLLVSHTNGPIQEETHYYPFGLTMSGISSKALNGVAENKFKYNGKEEQRKGAGMAGLRGQDV